MRRFFLLLALCLTVFASSACSILAEPTQPGPTQPVPPTTAATEPPTTAPPQTQPVSRVVAFELEPPWGFELSQSGEGHFFYASPDAPWDASALTVDVVDRDASILELEARDFVERPDLLPQDARELELLAYEQTELDRWPGVLLECTFSTEDGDEHWIRYEVVTTDSNYVFLYADRSQDQYWDYHFNQSISTIDLVEQTEQLERDYSGLAWTQIDGRLGMYVKDGLRPLNAPGFTFCMGDREVVVMIMADNKAEMRLTGLSLEDYGRLLCSTNDLEPFDYDSYGNLVTVFHSVGDDGKAYYNQLVVKQTDQDFWVCQMTCQEDDQPIYQRSFGLWASSIQAIHGEPQDQSPE